MTDGEDQIQEDSTGLRELNRVNTSALFRENLPSRKPNPELALHRKGQSMHSATSGGIVAAYQAGLPPANAAVAAKRHAAPGSVGMRDKDKHNLIGGTRLQISEAGERLVFSPVRHSPRRADQSG